MGIKIISYNSTGLSPLTVQFIRDMINDEQPDIMLIQETFTLPSTTHKVDSIHKDYLVHVVNGTDESREILQGRPSGGVAILWKRSLAHCIQRIKPLSVHKRICAVRITTCDGDVVICNTYMPNDNYNESCVTDNFNIVCDQIELLFMNENPRYFILAGDLNMDFRRTNAHSRCVEALMMRLRVIDSWTLPNVIPQETYFGPNNSCATRLDYIMCSNSMRHGVSEFGVVKRDSNMSNHTPVKITVKMDLGQCERGGTESLSNMDSPRVAWCKVKDNHIQQYQTKLDEYLKQSIIPSAAFCQDLQCCDPVHRRQIDEWCNRLTDCCITAGLQCLPKRRHQSKIRPGWSDEVKNFKEDSLFWYHVWRSCGEPTQPA